MMKPHFADSESSEEDLFVERNLAKKQPITKRCWLFKQNKGFVPHKDIPLIPSLGPKVKINHYEEHRKFIANLNDYHALLPKDEVDKPLIVSQTTSDSEEDMLNLFVNNKLVYNPNVNIKSLMNLSGKKEVSTSSLPNYSIFNGSRSLRLNRKCKEKTRPIQFDDTEFDMDSYNFYSKNTKKHKFKYVDTENGIEDSQSVLERASNQITEEKPVIGEILNKKRKVELKQDRDDCVILNVSTNNPISQTNAKPYITQKGSNKMRINSECKPKSSDTVIEILEEKSENDDPVNKEDNSSLIRKIDCPMCNRLFPIDQIDNHAYTCQGPQTQTRSRADPNFISSVFDTSSWDRACKGFDDNKHISHTSRKNTECNDGFERKKGSEKKVTNVSLKTLKDPLKEVKQKVNLDKFKKELSAGDQTKVFAPGFSKTSNLNKSTQDLIAGYTKAVKTSVKNPPAKGMRSFGQKDSQEELVQCARCDMLLADDQLKNHTDQCFEKSVLIE